jgi:hypothetical protein
MWDDGYPVQPCFPVQPCYPVLPRATPCYPCYPCYRAIRAIRGLSFASKSCGDKLKTDVNTLGLLPRAAQVKAMHMVTLEKRMLGPRYDCFGHWPVCPNSIVRRYPW